ncbi:hypothetical protein [Komagataeibacter oboediens]|nr:hypothetical protein [Komagataeibacter oboediens]
MAQNVKLSSHPHNGVTAGGDKSGPPVAS